jgi:hypothetical protein
MRFEQLMFPKLLEKTDHDANIRHTLFIVALTDNPPPLSYTCTCQTVATRVAAAIAAEMKRVGEGT